MKITKDSILYIKSEKDILKCYFEKIDYDGYYYNIIVNYNGKTKIYALESSFGIHLFLNELDAYYGNAYNVSTINHSNNYLFIRPIYTINYLINKAIEESTLSYQEKIKYFIEKRSIRNLYHFTNVNNLKSIFDDMLRPTSYLRKYNIDCEINDKYRLDKRENCVCFTVEFPNTWYLKNLIKKSKDKIFCILEYDYHFFIKACLEQKAYFSNYNAARNDSDCGNDISHLINMYSEEYYKYSPFTSMLNGFNSQPSYRSNLLPLQFPTHDQAEVLIEGNIKNEHIKRVIFETIDDYNYAKDLLDEYSILGVVDKNYFINRDDFIRGIKNGK